MDQELTAQELQETLTEEVDFYLKFRANIQDYTDIADEQEFRGYITDYFDVFPDFYTILADQIYSNEIELNTPEYYQYYEDFTLIYFNFLEEVIYLVKHYNQLQDEQLAVRDILEQIDSEDMVYSIYVQVEQRDNFKLIGDVSRGFILQAIRLAQCD